MMEAFRVIEKTETGTLGTYDRKLPVT